MQPNRFTLDPSLTTLLAELRRRIRRYVAIEGTARAAWWAAIAFWTSLVVDWFFEPGLAARAGVAAAILLGWAEIVRRRLAAPLLVPLRDRSLALLLERRFPQFGQSLTTAVEFHETGFDPAECRADMLDATHRTAAQYAREVQVERVFESRSLRRSLIPAVAAVLSIAGFAAAAPDALGVWARRTFAFSEEAWPRRTRLLVDGFENGVVKVARGGDVDLIVRADLAKPWVPETVEIVARRSDGSSARFRMNREGIADPAADAFQEYAYKFQNVLVPTTFDVVGGDDAVRGLRLETVDNPILIEVTLRCEYPEYIERSPETTIYAGTAKFPRGSRIVVEAKSNKDLVTIAAESGEDETRRERRTLRPDSGDPRRFTYAIDRLESRAGLWFTLHDADGVKSREAVHMNIVGIDDRPPEVAVQLRGIGQAITPQASLPIVGRVADDYGLAKIWTEYAVDQGKTTTLPLASPTKLTTEAALDHRFDVRPLSLEPGKTLQLRVRASDRSKPAVNEANVGSGDRWQLQVIAPEQLKLALEARELMLRRRFEAILKEMVDTHDALTRILPAPGENKAAADERKTAERLIRVQWAAQTSLKDAQEVLGSADAFDLIREELINNRIDTEEAKRRLESGIAAPLRTIGREMFPELDRRLAALQASPAPPDRFEEACRHAIRQTDAITAAMREVLARMIELEDFNEAVRALRTIIDSQDKVNDLTKQRQKERLRELLEQ